jgi:hypothetical protein
MRAIVRKVSFQVDAASSEQSARGRDRCRCGWNVAPSSDADHSRRDEPGTIPSLRGSLPAARTCAHTRARRQTADPRADNWKQRVALWEASLATLWWWARTWTPMLFGYDKGKKEKLT